jgi:hypothetical protein
MTSNSRMSEILKSGQTSTSAPADQVTGVGEEA